MKNPLCNGRRRRQKNAVSMRPIFSGLVALIFCAGPACAQHVGVVDVARLPVSAPTKVEAYGPGPLQFGELRVPKGSGPFPVAIIIHGGCFTAGYATLRYMSPIASALADKGVATWNIEYRQVGDAGAGWPGSFADWATAADHLRELAKSWPLDLTRVVASGHSAGATAALWLAARNKLPATSEIRGRDPLKIAGVVAIDGPGDLTAWVGPARACSRTVGPLMGGTPKDVPDRYAQGNPYALLPLGVEQSIVSASVLSGAEAAAYQKAATAKGDHVDVLAFDNVGHFDMLAPGSAEWAKVEAIFLKFAGQKGH
jgi:acetyl esterase/lipase